MPIYYLCSGFGMEHSFVNKFGELLSADLPVRNSLVVIPCTEDPEGLHAHFSFFTEQLTEAGISFTKHIRNRHLENKLYPGRKQQTAVCQYV